MGKDGYMMLLIFSKLGKHQVKRDTFWFQEAWQTSDESETGDGELQEAQLSVSTAEKDWGQQKGLWRTLLQVECLPSKRILLEWTSFATFVALSPPS